MRRMRTRRRKRASCGPLPAEQVASAQSHEVDLAGASRANRGEEHLKRRHTQTEASLLGTITVFGTLTKENLNGNIC